MTTGMLPTVASAFESYRRDVIPAAATDGQVEECRRAFYAGAWQMYLNLVLQTADLADAEGERYLEALRDELVRFKSAVGTSAEGDPATHSAAQV